MIALSTLVRVSTVLQGDFRLPAVDPTVGLGSSAFSAFVTTLIIGGIMVALAPAYTERLMGRIRDDAVGSFIYGLLALVALILVTVLLVVTIFGILLAIPLALIIGLAWAVGASIAFLAIGERLVGRDDGWLKPLAVGALVNGGLTLTGIGGLASFAIGAAGFGALLRDWQS